MEGMRWAMGAVEAEAGEEASEVPTVPTVFMAGAESAMCWNGYMDGAIESGEESAVLVALSLLKGDKAEQAVQSLRNQELGQLIQQYTSARERRLQKVKPRKGCCGWRRTRRGVANAGWRGRACAFLGLAVVVYAAWYNVCNQVLEENKCETADLLKVLALVYTFAEIFLFFWLLL